MLHIATRDEVRVVYPPTCKQSGHRFAEVFDESSGAVVQDCHVGATRREIRSCGNPDPKGLDPTAGPVEDDPAEIRGVLAYGARGRWGSGDHAVRAADGQATHR